MKYTLLDYAEEILAHASNLRTMIELLPTQSHSPVARTQARHVARAVAAAIKKDINILMKELR